MNKNYITETMGWIGALTLIIAYALNSYGLLSGQSFSYQFLNFTASLVLMVYTYIKKAFPNTFLNLVWAIIAISALLKMIYFQ